VKLIIQFWNWFGPAHDTNKTVDSEGYYPSPYENDTVDIFFTTNNGVWTHNSDRQTLDLTQILRLDFLMQKNTSSSRALFKITIDPKKMQGNIRANSCFFSRCVFCALFKESFEQILSSATNIRLPKKSGQNKAQEWVPKKA